MVGARAFVFALDVAVLSLGGCRFSHAVELDAPPGDVDATPTLVDAAPAPWWDPAYTHRRRIAVHALDAVPAQASLAFVFDTGALVQQSLARDDTADWRIVRQRQTAAARELDRWIDDIDGSWNATDTRTWFPVEDPVAAGATDGDTFVYYGNPAPAADPPADLSNVFLFGDDFEAGLGAWANNNRGENGNDEQPSLGSSHAFRIDPGGTAASGYHVDKAIPDDVVVSAYLLQDSTNASFGVLRMFDTTFAGRTPPAWIDAHAVALGELDSSGAMQIDTVGGVSDWVADYGDQWHHVEFHVDRVANSVAPRIDGGPWLGPYAPAGSAHAVASFGLEGEGQNGRFHVDNYTIRRWIGRAPEIAIGDEETAP